MVKYSWLKRYDEVPSNIKIIAQSWDTGIKSAASNDYSVCTTWAESENAYYLIGVQRVKLEYPELKRKIIELAEKYDPETILIEDKASGQSLIQDIRSESRLPIVAVNPINDKVTRFASVSTMLEAGKVLFPKKAMWLADLEAELLAFPNAVHDDQVDSISQFLTWVKIKRQFNPRMRRIF